MKTRPIITTIAAATLGVGAMLPIRHLLAQDAPRVQRSGKIEMQIDPNQPGFDAEKLEKDIRKMAAGMDLGEEQQARLEDSIKQLREGLKPGTDGKSQKFTWKWEYKDGGDEPKAKPDAPQPRRQQGGNRTPEGWQQLQEEMQKNFGERLKELMGERGELNPERMMEDLLRRMGVDPNDAGQFRQDGQDGQKRFFFRFGPNGMEQREEGNDVPDELRRQFGLDLRKLGGHEHGNYDPDNAPRNSKYSRATLAEYRDVVRNVRGSTVAILREGHQVALGTVVSADGYAVTKASEVAKGGLECETMDGSIVPAKVVSKNETYDVALIKLDGAKDLKPVTFATGEIPVGTMVAASGIDENPVSVGVVSVPPRNLDDSQKGFLGLAVEDGPDGKSVVVKQVTLDSPASKVELQAGDTITAVDGEGISEAAELEKLISGKSPGDKVKLAVKGGDGTREIEITLSSREQFSRELTRGVDPTARMGTELSGKSTGFPNAIQNDLGIEANQCGGPVVDIQGNVIGINIARSGRTSTYMLAGKILTDMLSELKNGKLGMVKDPAALAREVKKYEAEYQRLQDELKAAEAKLKAAKEADAQTK